MTNINPIFTEEEEFIDICMDLLAEGLIDEDQIEAEAHRILDRGDYSIEADEKEIDLHFGSEYESSIDY